METNRFRQFCTIVETGNLRKAANLIGISHSGLSKSMKVLEIEVGFPLFLSSGRGIVISEGGMKLYERSPAFFSELSTLLGHGVTPEKKFIRIGSFEVFTTYFMGKALSEYLKDVEVEVHELVPGRLEESLILNKVDVGITYEPVPRRGIEYVKLKSIVMGVYKRNGTFSDQNVSNIPFVVPVSPLEGAPSGVRGRDGWPDERFKRNARYRVDLMISGIELVRRGLCAIFIPEFVARMYNENAPAPQRFESLPLPKQMAVVRRDIYIVKRESTVEDNVIKQIAKALRNLT